MAAKSKQKKDPEVGSRRRRRYTPEQNGQSNPWKKPLPFFQGLEKNPGLFSEDWKR